MADLGQRDAAAVVVGGEAIDDVEEQHRVDAHGAELERPGEAARDPTRPREARFDRVVADPQVLAELLTEWREPDLSTRALEQRTPDPAFLLLDRLAHPRLGDAEALRG